MSSTDPQDPTAQETGTELEVTNQRVAWLRNELEVVRAEAARAVAARPVGPLDQWVNVLKDYNELAQTLARTSFVPKDFQGKPDQITAGLMFGREIGLPPVTMMQNMHVIHGRVGMYAEQLRAMILAAGHEYEIEESSSDRCVISGRRKGSERWQQHEYTMDRAKLAGLWAQNDQYKKRPVEMLLARASGIMAHAQFPDVIRGMGAVEELESLEVGEADAPPAAAPVKAASTVTRKRAQAKPAEVTAGPAPQVADEVVIPDESEPLLPGEGVPSSVPGSVGATPGEGRASDSNPTGSAPQAEEKRECPHISNGQQCRYYADHDGKHIFGGGLGDPISLKHCGVVEEHPSHAWPPEKALFSCSGAELSPPGRQSEGDGSPDDLAATGTDEAYAKAELVDGQVRVSGPVADKPRPMHSAQTKALQARFKGLGFTDEPDDREQRLRVATAIVGHDVDTFRASVNGENTMSYDEAQAVLTALAPCRERGDVIELMVRIAAEETP